MTRRRAKNACANRREYSSNTASAKVLERHTRPQLFVLSCKNLPLLTTLARVYASKFQSRPLCAASERVARHVLPRLSSRALPPPPRSTRSTLDLTPLALVLQLESFDRP